MKTKIKTAICKFFLVMAAGAILFLVTAALEGTLAVLPALAACASLAGCADLLCRLLLRPEPEHAPQAPHSSYEHHRPTIRVVRGGKAA